MEQNMKFFTIIILLGLSLFTTLLFESRLITGYAIQLVLVLIGIILTAGIIFGLWIEEPWATPLTTIVFAASLANLVWLFAKTEVFLTFAFGLLVNVAGIVVCMAGMEKATPLQELETYHTGNDKKKKRK
jgi:hypothetical protein